MSHQKLSILTILCTILASHVACNEEKDASDRLEARNVSKTSETDDPKDTSPELKQKDEKSSKDDDSFHYFVGNWESDCLSGDISAKSKITISQKGKILHQQLNYDNNNCSGVGKFGWTFEGSLDLEQSFSESPKICFDYASNSNCNDSTLEFRKDEKSIILKYEGVLVFKKVN